MFANMLFFQYGAPHNYWTLKMSCLEDNKLNLAPVKGEAGFIQLSQPDY